MMCDCMIIEMTYCRYDGSLLDPAALSEAVSQGPASTEFTKLVSWLTDRLKDFCGLEETIHATHCRFMFQVYSE